MSHLHGECEGKLKQKRKSTISNCWCVCFFINIINTVIFLWKMFLSATPRMIRSSDCTADNLNTV